MLINARRPDAKPSHNQVLDQRDNAFAPSNPQPSELLLSGGLQLLLVPS